MENSVYDIIAPSAFGRDEACMIELGVSIVECLAEKGFCVIKSNVRDAASQQALEELGRCRDQFSPPPDEVVDGLLGVEGSQRVMELSTVGSSSSTSILHVLDQYMSDLAGCIEPMASHLGIQVRTRTPMIVHEASTSRDEFPEASYEEKLRWLQTFSAHRIMCLSFIGPGQGTLMLRPYWDDDSGYHVLDTEPGMWVILRADTLEHVFGSDIYRTYVASCWLLGSYNATRARTNPGFPLIPVAHALEESIKEDRDEQLSAHYKGSGMKIRILGAACSLPCARARENVCFQNTWSWLSNGMDAAQPISLAEPIARWEHAVFYDPNPESHKQGKIPTRHASFLQGIEMFDAKHFRISSSESQTLAPDQRKTLECGYEAMFDGGFTLETMAKTSTGVYVGCTWSEWNLIRPGDSKQQGAYGTTSNMTPIVANRLSYSLGLQGPSMSLDTEGSSSLVAVCKGAAAVHEDLESLTSLCAGISLILSPYFMLIPARAGLLSPSGRCFSFDACADGYICGDGCGAVVLTRHRSLEAGDVSREPELGRGMLNSGFMVNSGTVPVLSAPSGISDMNLLKGALALAKLSPVDVDAVECDSYGSLMSDAIEASAIARLLCSNRRGANLVMSSSKSQFGHTRHCAGVSALIRALASLSYGVPAPSCHLAALNPHLETFEEEYDFGFLSESLTFRNIASCVGVTSKGFGGTGAHAIVSGLVDARLLHPRVSTAYAPIAFWPGGGGELPAETQPQIGYAIVGSWSSWQTLEYLEEESPNVYGYTLTLGESGFERFVLLVDGRVDCVLHPGEADSSRNSHVYGPAASVEGLNWAVSGDGDGGMGDQYRVRLHKAGKWRMITWDKIGRGSVTRDMYPREPKRYFIVATWNDESLEDEMLQVPTLEGVFQYEIRLLRPGGRFHIVVDQDPLKRIYPSPFTNAALGPAAQDEASGMRWLLDGVPGDVFRISLEITTDQDSLSKSVSFSRVRNEPLTEKENADMSRIRYYVVGTWDEQSRTNEMHWNGDFYAFSAVLGSTGEETFQIFQDGSPRLLVHPTVENASFRDHPKVLWATPASMSTLRGNQQYHGHNMSWTIGRHSLDDAGLGRTYEIRLYVLDKVVGKIPQRVEWQPKREET